MVYREAAKPSSTQGGESTERRPRERSWTVAMPPTLLFRYSAISFNSHRIHYDQPYATGVEGYDGLVVHGPLQATLLLNLAAVQLGAPPRRFSYRGLTAAFAGKALSVCAGADGDETELWTEGPGGLIHMEAKVLGR
jgi:3-methylfumaryl-CoA hydratase